jgi:hypothetical protein
VLNKHVGELFDREGRIGRDQVETWLRDGFERVTTNTNGSGLKEVESR